VPKYCNVSGLVAIGGSPQDRLLDSAMPRISDTYLGCVIYLYASASDAEGGTRTGGSGFLLGVSAQRPGHFYVFAITNKHLIENGNTVIRVNTRDQKFDLWETAENNWVFHPDGDDLAICMITVKETDKYAVKFISSSILLDKETAQRLNIGPEDETFLVGRFISHEGRQTNLPTVRFGSIAQMPIEPIRQDHGFLQESFLVETKSIGGYSGSPVLVHIPAMTDREGVAGWYPPDNLMEMENVNYRYFQRHGPWLLGIDWGHINDWVPVCDARGNPINPRPADNMQVKVNTGLAAVVPAWKLAEMLDYGPAAEAMKKASLREAEGRNIRPPDSTEDGG
jgi:hypothetical protein